MCISFGIEMFLPSLGCKALSEKIIISLESCLFTKVLKRVGTFHTRFASMARVGSELVIP